MTINKEISFRYAPTLHGEKMSSLPAEKTRPAVEMTGGLGEERAAC